MPALPGRVRISGSHSKGAHACALLQRYWRDHYDAKMRQRALLAAADVPEGANVWDELPRLPTASSSGSGAGHGAGGADEDDEAGDGDEGDEDYADEDYADEEDGEERE